MPDVPPPEDLTDIRVYLDECEELPEKVRRLQDHQRPFEFRPVQALDVYRPQKRPPHQQIWFRTIQPIDDDDHLNRCMLAYASDYNLLPAAILPHEVSFLQGNMQMASLDHAMWFHHPVRVGEWMLYAVDSPSASGARGFARGAIYDRGGTLVASTAQEGVIRLWPTAKGQAKR